MPIAEYRAPTEDGLTEVDVYAALDFLIAVEPVPPAASRADYEAATGHVRPQIETAMVTLRRFAGQTVPLTLERMQRDYYRFSNDPRYLTSLEVWAIVTGALNEAWNGVGPWRR